MEENTKLQAEYSMPDEYEALPEEYPDLAVEIIPLGSEFNENVQTSNVKRTVKRSVQKSFMLLSAVVATAGVVASSSDGGLKEWWGTVGGAGTYFDSSEMSPPTDINNSTEIYVDSTPVILPEAHEPIYFPELDSAMGEVLAAVKTGDAETIIDCFKEHNETFQEVLAEYFVDYGMASIAYDGKECYLTFAMGLGGLPHKNNQLLIEVQQTFMFEGIEEGIEHTNYRVWQGDFSQDAFYGRVDYMEVFLNWNPPTDEDIPGSIVDSMGSLIAENKIYHVSGEFENNKLVGTWTMRESLMWSEFVVSGKVGSNEELIGLVTLSGNYENGEAWKQQVNVDENGCLIFDELIFDYRGQGFGDGGGPMPIEVAELAGGRCFVTEGLVNSLTGEEVGYCVWHNKSLKDSMWTGENTIYVYFNEPLFSMESYKTAVYSIFQMCGMEKPEQY